MDSVKQEKQTVLHISHLNKTLGNRQILRDVSFETYGGEVFGFLGPNGAGKTTTIKIAVGLLSLDEGDISIAGYDLRRDFEKALEKTGGIVENPEFYPYLSGYENLRIYARVHEGVTEERIKEVLELVGLSLRAGEKVGRYSLGMRQRLGVAQAILHRPRLLVLDEPTNGLDPAGTKALRDILKRLAHEEGLSIVVSSHLMSEMEMMCDRVGIIVDGEIRKVQPIEEMISSAKSGYENYVFHVSDAAKVGELLADLPAGTVTVVDANNLEVQVPGTERETMLAKINKTILQGGVILYTVSRKEDRKLEDVFIEMTNGQGGGQIG